MHRIDVAIEPPAGWIWDGYIAHSALTLLTGRRLVGKTTLLTGLLRSLADGRPFLGRPCTPARALVVACEPIKYWRQRLQVMPVGAHAQLLANPFRWRPTADQWRELIDHALAELDDKYRTVFVLRDVEGFSVKETANLLGISEANVKVRLLRARLALREKLTRVFGDEAARVFPDHRHGPHHPAEGNRHE